MDYPNVPRVIGTVLSAGKASAADLSETLSLEDVYDLVEIIAVDAHNYRILNPPPKA